MMMRDAEQIPRWLKLTYTLWFVVWVPVYWAHHGFANFLWMCDVANFMLLAALWLNSTLLLSAQAVGVLLIDAIWALDFFGRLLLGSHPIGGTEYMFDPAKPLWLRSFSLFHVFVPLILLWLLHRRGYDRRGFKLQAVVLWVVLPLSFFADPARNLNWLFEPFGIPQTLMAPHLWLLLSLLLYPIVLLCPAHWLLRTVYRVPSASSPTDHDKRA